MEAEDVDIGAGAMDITIGDGAVGMASGAGYVGTAILTTSGDIAGRGDGASSTITV
jgi:hypothetical protein